MSYAIPALVLEDWQLPLLFFWVWCGEPNVTLYTISFTVALDFHSLSINNLQAGKLSNTNWLSVVGWHL